MAGSSRINPNKTLTSASVSAYALSQPNPNNIPFQWIGYVPPAEPAATYRECQRNHAATIGRYAYDGCGEFLKAGKDGTREAFLCAACGCHRSFHRKVLAEAYNSTNDGHGADVIIDGMSRKKAKTKRTKTTDEQKVKMRRFAEKVGWKLQKHDEEEVENFCGEVGITRKMLKVWLSNNRRRPVREKFSVAVITEKNDDDQAVEKEN